MSASINLPPVAEYQGRSIFSPARCVVIEATTKAGKTLGCIWWLIYQAITMGAGEYWWVAPVYPQSLIAFRRTKTMLSESDPDQRQWKANEAEHFIRFSNGATLWFKSADNPDLLYGEDVRACVIDEATRCKEECWYAIRSTLTATRGMVRIIGNVKGKKNWAYKLARRVEAGDLPGWERHAISCWDAVKAGIIDHDEVEAARRELPAAVFAELYEGIPSEDGSNPFGYASIAACIQPLTSGPPSCFGSDLAKSQDWTVYVGLDTGGHCCMFDRWQHVPWNQTMDRLASVIGERQALIDSTGVGDPVVEELQRRCPAVEGFKFTGPSKQQLMEGLAVAIQQRNVTFPDGVIRSELESFEYEATRTGVRYSAPEGMHDDCVMALALAVRKLGTRGLAELVGGLRPNYDPMPKNPKATYDELRKDPDWGWIRV